MEDVVGGHHGADLLSGRDHHDVGGVDLRLGVVVFEPPLMPGHLDLDRVGVTLGQLEHRGGGGHRDPGQDQGGDDGPGDLQLRAAVELLGLLGAGAIPEEEHCHQDRPLHQDEHGDGDPEDRPEEVVDLLGERACRLEGGQRLILAA